MTDKKKKQLKPEAAEIEMPMMEEPVEYMPKQHMCPMMAMQAMPAMQPPCMEQMMMPPCMSMGPYMEAPVYGQHEMRIKNWYDDDDSDYSSDESDVYPYFYWKPKHKDPVYPWLWPAYFQQTPYHKKKKKK